MRTLMLIPMFLAVGACVQASDAAESREPDIVKRAMRQAQQPATAPSSQGSFVQHPENIQPGISQHGGFAQLTNPFQGDAAKVKEGGTLFVSYNCMDCHGADGSGAMGPSLADGRFHFGGTAGEVFQSIYEGRPDGMPAWGGRIPDDQIWRLVAYVQSLGANKDVSTENFTGKTIQKMGH